MLKETNDPVFPIDGLPEGLRKFVQTEAVVSGTSQSLVAVLALMALDVCVARKFEVLVDVGWCEPLNLFWLLDARMLNRHSSALQDVFLPIHKFQSELQQVILAEQQLDMGRAKILKTRIRQQMKMAEEYGMRDSIIKEIQKMEQDLADLKPRPLPQLIVDAKMSLAEVKDLLAQQGQVAILDDSGLFVENLTRFTPTQLEAVLPVLIQGHEGRDSRPKMVKGSGYAAPALSLLVAASPESLQKLMARKSIRNSSLFTKFQFLRWTNERHDSSEERCEVPHAIEAEYQDRLRRLLLIPPGLNAQYLVLSSEARLLFYDYAAKIQSRLSTKENSVLLNEWITNLPGTVARIAGLLHLWIHAKDAEVWNHPVEEMTLTQATRIVEYLATHARTFFIDVGLDPKLEAARHLLDLIHRKNLDQFTRRQLHQHAKGKAEFRSARDLTRTLGFLVQHGDLELVEQDAQGGRGRPPGPVFRLAQAAV